MVFIRQEIINYIPTIKCILNLAPEIEVGLTEDFQCLYAILISGSVGSIYLFVSEMKGYL